MKFAKYEPGENELRELHASAVRLVEETEPRQLPVIRESQTNQNAVNWRQRSRDQFRSSIFAFAAVAAAGLAWLKGRRGQPPAFLYSSTQLLRGMFKISRRRSGGFLATLRWLVLALFIVALAQPRLTKSQTTVKASGIDIVVAIDLSGSMEFGGLCRERGERVNRLDMAREVLTKFIQERPNDRIGLVAFASQAYHCRAADA